jgi:hypothetical protein
MSARTNTSPGHLHCECHIIHTCQPWSSRIQSKPSTKSMLNRFETRVPDILIQKVAQRCHFGIKSVNSFLWNDVALFALLQSTVPTCSNQRKKSALIATFRRSRFSRDVDNHAHLVPNRVGHQLQQTITSFEFCPRFSFAVFLTISTRCVAIHRNTRRNKL